MSERTALTSKTAETKAKKPVTAKPGVGVNLVFTRIPGVGEFRQNKGEIRVDALRHPYISAVPAVGAILAVAQTHSTVETQNLASQPLIENVAASLFSAILLLLQQILIKIK
ncbi:MAG: hypothetical protein KAT34_04545 [Candidatus Aminicenantes bacterium]|nr:hypothetical protein [Candidatus Aminicenantes bacterium]